MIVTEGGRFGGYSLFLSKASLGGRLGVMAGAGCPGLRNLRSRTVTWSAMVGTKRCGLITRKAAGLRFTNTT
jgi:hypothetical protein